MDALIGSTGFVGQALLAQRAFGAGYHSADIEAIEGRQFDRIVCAGVRAVKWWANANAEADRAGIERLTRRLERVRAERFVLISTVDVYGTPLGVDEEDAVPEADLHPYGLHRAWLEDWVRERFPVCHVIRLPALFGPGLKKNALYDLLHDNRLEHIDPSSRFQWYPLERLADDIDRVQVLGLPLVNLVTEPVSMAEIRGRFFPDRTLGGPSGGSLARSVAYDVRTRHGAAFGGGGDYAMCAEAALQAMGRFVAARRA
jgi:hypothetical protein